MLCAGVTVYKGLKGTEVRPGEWVAISGIGGLGHTAVQYAKAMGMHVAAIDNHEDKLALAKSLGADLVLDGRDAEMVDHFQCNTGGAHGVLVTAYRQKRSSKPMGLCVRAAPWRWSACRRASSACRFLILF